MFSHFVFFSLADLRGSEIERLRLSRGASGKLLFLLNLAPKTLESKA